MRYCRFENDGSVEFGLVESVAGREEITAILQSPEQHADPAAKSIPGVALSEARILAPVQPSKIVCVGRNYREHAAELGNEVPSEPLIFFKPPSSLLKPGGMIVLPPASSRVDHEGELAIVIGQRASKLQPDFNLRAII